MTARNCSVGLPLKWPAILAATLCTWSCRALSPATADIKVTNGIEGTPTPDIRRLGTAGGICTGTFVAPSTLLTAAHCVSAIDPGGGILVDGFKSLKAFVNPRFFALFDEAGPGAALAGTPGRGAAPVEPALNHEHYQTYDLAVVVFPPDTATTLGVQAYRAVRTQPAAIGENIFVVGFGDNDWTTKTGSGVFRWGKNVVAQATPDILVTKGRLKNAAVVDGTDANAGHGDSGAPLVAQGQEILGTVSSGGPLGSTASAIYVNLTSAASQALFARAIHCETAPCAQNFAGSGVAAP